MNFKEIPRILTVVSKNLEEEIPRDLKSLAELLEISYNYLEHPILKSWRHFKPIDSFEQAMKNPALHKVYNRTLVERTIRQAKYYYESIALDRGTLTIKSKGIEFSILVLRNFIETANRILEKNEQELQDIGVGIAFFRLSEAGHLDASVKYFIQTCNELILITLQQYLDQILEKNGTEEDKIETLLKWEASTLKNKDQYAPNVFNGIIERINIELSYFKKLKESRSSTAIDIIIETFLKEKQARISNHKLLLCLLEDRIKDFNNCLSELILNLFSYHDISGENPEKVYHAFLLGLLNSFAESYKVSSNKESGLGRFDILLIPNTVDSKGIIIEVKKSPNNNLQTIDTMLDEALQQIIDNKYYQTFSQLGMNSFHAIAAIFYKKQIFLKSKEYSINK